MTNFDKHDHWELEGIDKYVQDSIFYSGCPQIVGGGIVIKGLIQEKPFKESVYSGCSWATYSPDFLKPLNKLTDKERRKMSIYELAKKLDLVNKTKLIIDISNTGTHYWVPDKQGNKTIVETCSVVTITKREELPRCSLKKIFGDDFRVKLVTPKELSERIIIPWVNKSLGPFPEDLWLEIKKMSKIKDFRLNDSKMKKIGQPPYYRV